MMSFCFQPAWIDFKWIEYRSSLFGEAVPGRCAYNYGNLRKWEDVEAGY